MADTYSVSYKLIILGDGQVGKSSMIHRFISNEFSFTTPMTIGVSDYSKIIQIDDEQILLTIWDTAGQERYQSIIPAYFRGSKAAIILYDITNEATFKKVSYWINQVKLLSLDDVCFMLIGNKADLEEKRKVPKKAAIELAKANAMLFFETSCLSSLNVELAFIEITKCIRDKQNKFGPQENESEIKKAESGISLDRNTYNLTPSKKKKGCCGKS